MAGNFVNVTFKISATLGGTGVTLQPNEIEDIEYSIPDLDSKKSTRSARGILTRDRLASIPDIKVKTAKGLTIERTQAILTETKGVACYITWLNPYVNALSTDKVYCVRPKLKILKFWKQANASSQAITFLYDSFELSFKGFQGVANS